MTPNINYLKDKNNYFHLLLNINLFLQHKFLTKTCHIMIPTDRDFNKDSKKYLFAILGFFLQIAMNFQSLLQKG